MENPFKLFTKCQKTIYEKTNWIELFAIYFALYYYNRILQEKGKKKVFLLIAFRRIMVILRSVYFTTRNHGREPIGATISKPPPFEGNKYLLSKLLHSFSHSFSIINLPRDIFFYCQITSFHVFSLIDYE